MGKRSALGAELKRRKQPGHPWGRIQSATVWSGCRTNDVNEGLTRFWPSARGESADRMNKTAKIVFAHRGSLKRVTPDVRGIPGANELFDRAERRVQESTSESLSEAICWLLACR